MAGNRTSLVVEPSDGEIPARTAIGQVRADTLGEGAWDRSVRSRTVFAILLILVVGTACGSEPPRAEIPLWERTPKVLLIGIDGVRADVLADVSTPNLDALVTVGSFTAQTRTTTPSVSGPAWSSMLTGVWPDKHGVTSNRFTNPRYDRYPDFLTRIEQVRPELATFAVVDWLPLGQLDEGGPALSDRIDVRKVLDGSELGWANADTQSVGLAVQHLNQAESFAKEMETLRPMK